MGMSAQCGACQAEFVADADVVHCPECGVRNRVGPGTPKKPDMVIPPPGDRWANMLPDEPEPEPDPRARTKPARGSRRGGMPTRGTRDLLPRKRGGPRSGTGGKGGMIAMVVGIIAFVILGVVVTGMILSGRAVKGDTDFNKTVSLSPGKWKRGLIDASSQWSYKFTVAPKDGPVLICLIKTTKGQSGEALRNMVRGNSIEVAAGSERKLEDSSAKEGEYAWYVMNASDDSSVTVEIHFHGE